MLTWSGSLGSGRRLSTYVGLMYTVVPIEASINWTIMETSFALSHSHSCESQLQLCTHQDLVCVSIYASSAIPSIADNNERRFKEPLVARTVDEKGRRAVHSATHPAQKVFAYPVRIAVRGHLTNKERHIKTDPRGTLHQISVVQRLLMFK